MSYKDSASQRDQAADTPAGTGPAWWLMCTASGCPNRWTVHMEGEARLCSAHSRVEPKDWPRITQEQLQLADRARWDGFERASKGSSTGDATPASTSKAWRELHGGGDES